MKLLDTRFYKESILAPDFLETVEDLDRWLLLAKRYDDWISSSTLAEESIPKKIHQIWLGGKLPEKYHIFTDSWPAINPEYEYKLWGESDILELLDPRLQHVYSETKNFGAKSDIARYAILQHFGGIYADTDFECLRPLDGLVDRTRFFAGITVDTTPQIMNSLIAATPGHPVIKAIVQALETPVTSNNGRTILESTGPFFFSSKYFEFFKLTNQEDIIFPTKVFYPFPSNARYQGYKNPEDIKKRYQNESAFAIHYWEVSWQKKDAKIIALFKGAVKRILIWKKLKPFINRLKKRSK